MGKNCDKQLNVEEFESAGWDGFIVVGWSNRYAVAYKKRNNAPGWKVWVLEGRHPILSYNESGYRLRDQTCELAQRHKTAVDAKLADLRAAGKALSKSEYIQLCSDTLTDLMPDCVCRLVEQCWTQRDTLYEQYCALRPQLA